MDKRPSQPASQKVSWGLLESFLIAAESASIRQASQIMGVNHSTVSRQLKQLEQQLGRPLFTRYNQGLQLTAFGEGLYQHTKAMDSHFDELQVFVNNHADELAGSVHLSLGDSLLPSLLPAISALRQQHPKLECRLSLSNALAKMEKGEADIALRITQQPPEQLVGHLLTHLQVAPYVRRGAFDLNDTTQLPWVAWQLDNGVASTDQHPASQRQAIQTISCRVDSSSAMLAAVKAGLGAGYMLCCIADREEELQAISPPSNDQALPLWLLYHPQGRQSLKIQAVVAAIKKQFQAG